MADARDGVRLDDREWRLRLGFGFTVGAAVGAATWVSLAEFSWLSMGLAALGGGIVGGTLARHFGDRFWASLRWWS
jgi:hypothetical protein